MAKYIRACITKTINVSKQYAKEMAVSIMKLVLNHRDSGHEIDLL